MERSKDEKYLMTPYSLDEDRNKKDPRRDIVSKS